MAVKVLPSCADGKSLLRVLRYALVGVAVAVSFL